MSDKKRAWQLSLASMVRDIALGQSLDPAVVWGVVQQESTGEPWAYRYEPGWRWFTNQRGLPLHATRDEANVILSATEFHSQSASWGLMQVMGSVARELGHTEPISKLLDSPHLALHLGCRKLSKLLAQFDMSLDDALSAYNDGDGYTGRDNMHYVTGVHSHMATAIADKELAALLLVT